MGLVELSHLEVVVTKKSQEISSLIALKGYCSFLGLSISGCVDVEAGWRFSYLSRHDFREIISLNVVPIVIHKLGKRLGVAIVFHLKLDVLVVELVAFILSGL